MRLTEEQENYEYISLPQGKPLQDKFNKSKHAILGETHCHFCGNKIEKKISCSACNKVAYCTSKCVRNDSPYHQRVCDILATLQEDADHSMVDVKREIEEAWHRRYILDAPSSQQDTKKRRLNPAKTTKTFWKDRCIDPMKQKKVSELFSFPLTIANVIEENGSFLVPKRRKWPSIFPKNTMVIHVVGASTLETDHLPMWKELHYFIHLLYPKILHTHIFLVGPDLPLHDQKKKEVKYCNDNLRITLIKAKYHSIFNLRTIQVPQPQLVVLFQPGLSVPEYKWKKTLAQIAQLESSFVLLTSNSKLEMIWDVDIFLKRTKKAYIPITNIDENLFSSHRFQQSNSIKNELYTKNNYRILFRPKELISH